MRGSCHVNGVARLHGKVSQRLFQVLFPGWPEGEIPVSSITNGVHVPTWHSEPANQLWSDAYGTDGPWLGNAGAAAKGIEGVSDERLWDYRAEARKTLVDYVRLRLQRQLRERNAPEAAVQKAQRVLDPNRITLGFARRFAAYKRPNLLLDDQDRFIRILRNVDRPMQIVVAGKAHPDDNGGKAMVQRVVQFARRDDVREHVVFLEDYDMVLAQHFAAGIDVWINNPRRPAEAFGTSGMKMLVNGGLHCSILDGWWDEAYTPEVGWEIGGTREHSGEHDHDDARALYDLLEQVIAPEFYDRDHLGAPRVWMRRVRASMTQLTEQFSSDRMVREYVEHAYLPRRGRFCDVPRTAPGWPASSKHGPRCKTSSGTGCGSVAYSCTRPISGCTLRSKPTWARCARILSAYNFTPKPPAHNWPLARRSSGRVPFTAPSTATCTGGACPPIGPRNTTHRGSCRATPKHSCPRRPRTSSGEN